MSEGLVPVQIFGQRYPIRSSLDPQYVQELASYVDERMRAAADQSPAGDSLRLAVLAALNIADEAFRTLDAEDGRPATLSARLAAIESLIDKALAEAGPEVPASLDPPPPSF
jgi:cell division protein ZapA